MEVNRMIEYIDFMSDIPWDKMEILLELGDEFAFDPSSSVESEKYFIELLSKYQNNDDNLTDLLREEIKKEFKVIEERPKWIQNPDWQFNNGKPMEFVGQLKVKQGKSELHDDAIFYIFWDREMGIIKTIMQIA